MENSERLSCAMGQFGDNVYAAKPLCSGVISCKVINSEAVSNFTYRLTNSLVARQPQFFVRLFVIVRQLFFIDW